MSVKFFLRDDNVRRNLIDYILKQPTNKDYPLVVTISDPQRTLPQNSLFHALCGDIARAGICWAGAARSRESWKSLLVSGHAVATGKPGEVVEGLEGELVAVRESTSQMGVKRMNSLIEYTRAFAVSKNVRLREVRYSGDYFGRAL